jgi:hypothetical protein
MSTVLAALATLLAACSGAGPTPSELARSRMEALALDHADDETFTLRLNPALCDCPEFEVLLGDTWQRVFLEPKDIAGPAEGARALLNGTPESPPPTMLRVTGRLSKSIRMAGNRAPSLVLNVLQTCGREGCGPAN